MHSICVLLQATRRFANLGALATKQGTVSGKSHGRRWVRRMPRKRVNRDLTCVSRARPSSRVRWSFLTSLAMPTFFIPLSGLRSDRFGQALDFIHRQAHTEAAWNVQICQASLSSRLFKLVRAVYSLLAHLFISPPIISSHFYLFSSQSEPSHIRFPSPPPWFIKHGRRTRLRTLEPRS